MQDLALPVLQAQQDTEAVILTLAKLCLRDKSMTLVENVGRKWQGEAGRV